MHALFQGMLAGALEHMKDLVQLLGSQVAHEGVPAHPSDRGTLVWRCARRSNCPLGPHAALDHHHEGVPHDRLVAHRQEPTVQAEDAFDRHDLSPDLERRLVLPPHCRLLQDLGADERVGDDGRDELGDRCGGTDQAAAVVAGLVMVHAPEELLGARGDAQERGDQRVHDRRVHRQDQGQGDAAVEVADAPVPIQGRGCGEEARALRIQLVAAGDDLEGHRAQPVELLG
mmetsp:Transcript_47308/g.137768  ORF Transcript_47308/g.137768 Transcript_47308/m.137768 type:complete len:229 (-) Transcript_47308:531-1217(-)